MSGIHWLGPSSVAAVISMHSSISTNSGRKHAAIIWPPLVPLATRSVGGNWTPLNSAP